ncbi:hypothetical protein ACFP2T_22860 [Plantactinospora solaniradicis]|uniref:Uncharacterized protein n=1 Tax=Plantactinospora solaniradicis TaxID=1723736 RepID=A0ABW1KE28_9ACTN
MREWDVHDLPTTVAGWREYLAGYSADYLRVADEQDLAEVSAEQRAAGWLGFAAATEAQVAALEKRLGPLSRPGPGPGRGPLSGRP